MGRIHTFGTTHGSPPTPLAHAFPHLFSHSTLQLVKVANVLRYGLKANLRNRLSFLAEQELVVLLAVLQDFAPMTEEDQMFLHQGLDFSTKHAYGALMARPYMDLIAPSHMGHQGSSQAKNLCLATLQGPPQY